MGHCRHEKNSVRKWDNMTPYSAHPMWCAMSLLTETSLPEKLRTNGCKALMWHDVLEDTTLTVLPDDTPQLVFQYVTDMTFSNFECELDEVWSKSKEIRLFKLYDKTSNLLDGTWMTDKKWLCYINFTNKLADDVEAEYGLLNIIKIARSIAIERAAH